MPAPVLHLGGCAQLTELTDEHGLGALHNLRRLWLSGCAGLRELPDLTALRMLDVLYLPAHLEAWEWRGRRKFRVRGLEAERRLQQEIVDVNRRSLLLEAVVRYQRRVINGVKPHRRGNRLVVFPTACDQQLGQ